MSIRARHHRTLITLGLFIVAAAAIASTVTINGYIYSCENQCVLSLSDGVWTLRDSGGGLVRNLGPAKKTVPPKG
jgi:hypothetical protein